MCGEEAETILHALALCNDVKHLWQVSPLRIDIRATEDESLMDWVSNLRLVHDKEEWWDIFWSILWGVWLRRNAWVF